MSEIDRRIGQSIRTYRRARHMTLEGLASAIHKSKATVGKYEQGTIALDVDTLFEIARTFGIKPAQLFIDLSRGKESPASGAQACGRKEYLYFYDGRTGRMVRSLLVRGDGGEAEPPVTLFYNLPSFDEAARCRALYYGKLQEHDFVTNYLLENQSNGIEHVFICMMKPLDYSGRETGLLSGISSRQMLPVSAKCLLSDAQLPEDEALKNRLLLSKEDLRLTRRFNMFVVDQEDY